MNENKDMMDFDPEIDAMFAAPIEEQVKSFIEREMRELEKKQVREDNLRVAKHNAKVEAIQKARA
ncbi:hypothetical protein NLS50_004442 [Escherichia coli]|nr:hypothetical protein [Escherichia coli]EJK7533734.1 hypothetical protein [Escherichia coli]